MQPSNTALVRRVPKSTDDEIIRSFELPNAEGGTDVWDDVFMVASIAGVSYDLATGWIRKGLLPAKQLGRRRVVKRTDLAKFLDSMPALVRQNTKRKTA